MTNIEDLRQRARRRLPRTIFEFVDGGSQDELSLRANRTDFQKLALLPRVLTDVSVLVLTVDTKAQGPRERDIRNGFTVPPRVTARNLFDFARRIGWLADVALGPRITFGNLAGSLVGSDDIISVARFAAEQYDPSIDWSALEWCKSIWRGPVAVKGVLTPEDARLAIQHGADAVIVSNHGGRQLDGSPSAIAMLPIIAEVCADRAEVILDGGVRRGSDVLKALALGARACMAGLSSMVWPQTAKRA